MRTSPEMKKPSHLRCWSARLALFVACVASVATSAIDPTVSTEHPGTPLTLRTDAPSATRHFRIRVSTQRPPIAQPIALDVQANIAAAWRPDAPESPLTPVLSARMTVTPGPDDADSDGTSQTDFQSVQNHEAWLYPHAFSREHCKLEQLESECVWHATLKLEVDPRGTVGAIPLTWSLLASLGPIGSSTEPPEGLVVEITEE